MTSFVKYPRTPHLPGSRLGGDDHDLDLLSPSELEGTHVVIEEKLDGSNVGISFDASGRLVLQSRGHVLTGGPGERQYTMLKSWAKTHRAWLWACLGTRRILYGEWTYALHSLYYDQLPHYFHEFDIYDRELGVFLSTPARHRLLEGGPVVSVPVLYSGPFPGLEAVRSMVGPSLYRSELWRERQREAARQVGMDPDLLARQVDDSDLAEGCYIKIESGDETTGRAKWVRSDFIDRIRASGTHWKERPLVVNALEDGADLFSSIQP